MYMYILSNNIFYILSIILSIYQTHTQNYVSICLFIFVHLIYLFIQL